ncbi:MAG TPA: M1 family metallopeptidase, partial [Candidatus Eisenbacteria bacterium]|nr:M1 family metallopeptidase [Candidatus Eisenbacteria bacterium]
AYWNLSPDTLSELYFHLYLNAYRPGSHMARAGASREDWRIENLPPRRRGGEWIDGATILHGDSLHVVTDDTIARMTLREALAPGESVIVCLSFRSNVPDVPERMGRSGKGIFAAQWYPRVCVYDRFGWHTEQHLGSEFYGDFGAYDVRIALPGNFLVAHTGTLVNPAEVLPDSILARLLAPGDSAVTIWDRSTFRMPSDSTARHALELPRTWVIHADSVHDFAWACEEKWIWRRARWNGIEIYTFHRGSDSKRWNEMANVGARMMEVMNRRFGPYPYPRFSFVEEPIGAGGVEFPNIVWITPRPSTTGVRRLEYLFAHELAHNWFYGMVGNNETAQAFLDEGLTSFAETSVMETLFGREGNLTLPRKPAWLFPKDDSRRNAWRNYLEFQARGIEEPVVTHSDRFKNPAAYYPSVYHKTNVGLWTLRSIAGGERFDEALREYFAIWRFHHPYADDFFASMNHALGASYDWFWDGWFLRTDAIDVALEGSRVVAPGRRADPGSERAPDDSFRVELRLRSRGGIDPPVPVVFRDRKGREVTHTVPREVFLGAAGDGVYRATLPFAPSGVELDPAFTLPDLSWSDNRTSRWPRVESMFDNWRASPQPIGRTLLLWRPDLWYQADDGPEAGIAFDASTVRWQRALHGLAGVGARSPRPFADFEARFRSLAADPREIARARGYDMDGHRGFRVSLSKDLDSKIEKGFRWKLQTGVDYDELHDRDTPRRPAEWSRGDYANLEGILSTSRKLRRVRWEGSVRLRTDLLTERVSYGSLYAATTAEVSVIPKFPLQLRAVAGRVRGGDVPPEERFYLAGAGPRGEWSSRWFRSRGTIPTHWIAALGGDGNVRAFADTRPSGRTLVALNAESRSGRFLPAWVPVLGKLRVPVIEPRTSLFADIGKVSEGGIILRDLAADFGVGVRTKPLFRNHLTLRTDLPLYRTPPEAGERPWKLRAVLSVGEAF